MPNLEMPPIAGESDIPPAGFTPIEEPYEAALFRADRIYLPDELPSVKDLSNDFRVLLDGQNYSKHRASIALEYADHLKARFHPGEFSISNPEYGREQILPRLYLDMMVLTARRSEYQTLLKQLGKRNTAASFPSLHRLIRSKLEVQQDIADYDALHPDKSTNTLFGNLVTTMHHGRRLLYGDEVTFDKAKQQNEIQLLAILAEYKVLTALHEEWPQATFGTVEEDQNGTDIVVPSHRRPSRAVALQVKSRIEPDYDLVILGDKVVKVPEIRVPMNVQMNDPFRLSLEHSDLVRQFVRNSPPIKLAVAA